MKLPAYRQGSSTLIKTSGLQPGDLIIVAIARLWVKPRSPSILPSMSPLKTFARRRFLDGNGRCAVGHAYARLGRTAGSKRFENRQAGRRTLGRLNEAVVKLSDAPMFIDETPNLTALELRARARRLARRFDGRLGLIVIDYLQLMAASGRSDNRASELGEISRSSKPWQRVASPHHRPVAIEPHCRTAHRQTPDDVRLEESGQSSRMPT